MDGWQELQKELPFCLETEVQGLRYRGFVVTAVFEVCHLKAVVLSSPV